MSENKPSQILITFEQPGSVRFEAKVQNVAPEQMMFLGAYFAWYAQGLMGDTQVTGPAEQPKIMVPKMHVVKSGGNHKDPLGSDLIRGG